MIGEPDTADFTFDIASSSVQIVYTAPGEGAGTRITYVNLVCDPRATDPIVVANGEIDTQQYSFTLTHRCTCPGLCGSSASTPNPDTPTPAPGSPGSDDSLDVSIGTVICIVVLGLLVVYLATGITFQRVKRQASGKEVIPNVTFWQALPGLIKDGFVFSFGLCKKSSSSSYQKL